MESRDSLVVTLQRWMEVSMSRSMRNARAGLRVTSGPALERPGDLVGKSGVEKQYETLLTREEMIRAVDLGGYYRVPADTRDLGAALLFWGWQSGSPPPLSPNGRLSDHSITIPADLESRIMMA